MIYKSRFVIPVTSDPVENGEVLVKDGRIATVGRGLAAVYPDEFVMDLGDAAILPGFVNAHSHLDYTLVRGRIGDVRLFEWVLTLGRYADVMTDEDFYWSSMLGLAEGIASGYTTFADASYSGQPVKAMSESGVSGISYREVFAFRPHHDLKEALSLLKERLEEMRQVCGPDVAVGVSPHSPYLARPELLEGVNSLVRSENLPVSVHVSESREELSFISEFQGPYADLARAGGWHPGRSWRSPVDYLDHFGFSGPNVQYVHCVFVDAEDIERMSEAKTPVAHCPKSNAKLGRGIAPVVEMIRAGLNAGLGTDSTVSNNVLSPFEEMRFAADLQRSRLEDAQALTAKQALELATIVGARSIGLGEVTGSIEEGKRADLVAVGLSSLAFQPASDPIAGIVFSASASDVILTVAGGRELYRYGEHLSLDVDEVVLWARKSIQRIEQAPGTGSRVS